MDNKSASTRMCRSDETTMAPATPYTKDVVVVPAVGGVDENGTPWTGGRRTGSGRNTIPNSPFCARPVCMLDCLDIYSYATTGLRTKYQGDNVYTLTMFGRIVNRHLKATGMDGVFYFTDPVDGIEKSLIDHHPLFTLEYIQNETQKLLETSDMYDVQNLSWSESFLYDSLSTEQQFCLMKYMPTISSSLDHMMVMNGPILWKCIAMENQSDSPRALRKLVEDLEHLELTSYPGENVKVCTMDIDAMCRRLEAAQRLPKDILSIICGIFMTSSVKHFRSTFHVARSNLDGTSQDYHSIIALADKLYQGLVESGEWITSNKSTG